MPRKPQRKPKPIASEDSGSKNSAASLRRSLSSASRIAGKSSDDTGNRPANTRGCMVWKPGSGAGAGLPAWVSVSPTGAPCTSLIEALIQPTSPADSLSSFLRLGVNTPTSSTSWLRPVDITSSLSPGLISPCMTRTSEITPR